MSNYAQKNYLAIQGIGGRYRIDQIGCFLDSFCNLFSDFGRDIDPPTLNLELINKGIYIDIDDGIRDDLGWNSITQDDPSIVATRVVDMGFDNPVAGWPNTNESIVRFWYRSVQSGKMITHFCKVADAANHLILDSWDGKVKQSPYGEPTAFAEYEHIVPVQVTPPPPYRVVESFDPPKWIQLNKDTNLWGMNYPTFDYMESHPVETGHAAGEKWQVTNKVHHVNGEDYYRREGQVDGFNVKDCDDYTPPAPDEPKLTIVDSTAPTPTPADVEEKIPVKVVHNTEPLYTPFPDGVHRFTAKVSMHVFDIKDPTVTAELIKTQPVFVAGTFTYKGDKYYRTAKSVTKGLWVAIPVYALKQQTFAEDDDQAFAQIAEEMRREVVQAPSAAKAAAIKKVGRFAGFIYRLFHKKQTGVK
jgi:hypothetical protein